MVWYRVCREISQDLANNEVLAILTPLGTSCLVRNLVIQSCLQIREILVRSSRLISESEKYCKISQNFSMYSTGLGQVYGSEMAQKPALLAVCPITVQHLLVQAPALTVCWAITDPFISNWLYNLLHLSERFCEEVCDCQVCWYVNRADNRWHWVQEAVLVFSHILLSKIHQSIWK